MRFIIDAQLPASLADLIRSLGHGAVHVLEIHLAQSADAEIWNYASDHQATIVTKDEDFANMVLGGRMGVRVVWLRVGNCSNVRLLEVFAALLPQLRERLEKDECLIEVW